MENISIYFISSEINKHFAGKEGIMGE